MNESLIMLIPEVTLRSFQTCRVVRNLRKRSREHGNRKTAQPKTHDPAGRGNDKKATSLCFVKFWCSCLFRKTIEDIQHKYSVNCAVHTWNRKIAIQMPTQLCRGRLVEIKQHTCPGWTAVGVQPSGHHAKASRCASPASKWEGSETQQDKEKFISLCLNNTADLFTTSADLKGLLFGFKSRINVIINYSKSKKKKN